MSSGAAKPELAVNQHGATVADTLNGFIGHAADGLAHDVRLDIATAYFNVGGYSLLANPDADDGVLTLARYVPSNYRRGSAIDALQAPYTERITRLVRAALRSGRTPADQAVAVLRVVEEQGLQPQPAPEPLPAVTSADVHLVCWQALTAPV